MELTLTKMGRRPNPPCTALGLSFLEDIISKACSFCKLSQGINKKELKNLPYFSEEDIFCSKEEKNGK